MRPHASTQQGEKRHHVTDAFAAFGGVGVSSGIIKYLHLNKLLISKNKRISYLTENVYLYNLLLDFIQEMKWARPAMTAITQEARCLIMRDTWTDAERQNPT